MRDTDLAAELTRTAFRVARDAREQRTVGARHLHAFAERALRRHLDDPEQGAARVLRVEERRDRPEQRPGARPAGRRHQDAAVAHLRDITSGSRRSATMWAPGGAWGTGLR